MYLRPAVPADGPVMVEICARAFFNDDLFGRVIHPYRDTYPEDVQIYWHESLRRHWSSSRSKILVAVREPSSETNQETVVGVGIWERQGDDAGAQRAMDSFSEPEPWPVLERTQNRALDPSKKTIFQDSGAYIKHYWEGPRATNWYLAVCCVDPKFQQRGCGRLLADWGLKQAKEEGIRASVIASHGSTEFYLKCGFDEIVGNASQAGGAANPMTKSGVKGGDVLFTNFGGDNIYKGSLISVGSVTQSGFISRTASR